MEVFFVQWDNLESFYIHFYLTYFTQIDKWIQRNISEGEIILLLEAKLKRLKQLIGRKN